MGTADQQDYDKPREAANFLDVAAPPLKALACAAVIWAIAAVVLSLGAL